MYCRAVAASVIDYFIDLFWIFWISRVFISLLSSPYFICQLWWHELLWILYCSWPNVQWLYICLPVEEYTSPTKIEKPEKYIFQLYSWESLNVFSSVHSQRSFILYLFLYLFLHVPKLNNYHQVIWHEGLFTAAVSLQWASVFPLVVTLYTLLKVDRKKGKVKQTTLKKIFPFFFPVYCCCSTYSLMDSICLTPARDSVIVKTFFYF